MKTSLEMPDTIFRRARAQFVTEAVADKLKSDAPAEKPWIKHMGKLAHLHDETERIDRIIGEEFEKIDPEDWE